MRGFLVGGTSSGCGKTTVTLALMAALAARGLAVQGFKAGPDYIDPGLHTLATGRPSWNLDGWMCGEQAVTTAWSRVMAGLVSGLPDNQCLPKPDCAVVEGVMGLYDGVSGKDDAGSSAELAAWLGLPVVLVVNVRGMARSVGAMVRGYAQVRPDLRIGGIICTRAGSASHAQLLRDALCSLCPDIPLLGVLPDDPAATIPARHLGLHNVYEMRTGQASIAALGQWCASHVDMDALWQLAGEAKPLVSACAPKDEGAPEKKEMPGGEGPIIAVASDKAFFFTYPAFYDALHDAGARVVTFSPLADAGLPACDGVWIPGGYPELYARELAANSSLRDALQALAHSGMPVHGECGGYIWLMESLETGQGQFPMTGLFPLHARIGERRAALGYRVMRTVCDSAFGPAGTEARGHEFHYGVIVKGTTSEPSPCPERGREKDAPALWNVWDRQAKALGAEGRVLDSVSGSWIHVHPDAAGPMLKYFIRACSAWRHTAQHGKPDRCGQRVPRGPGV